IAGGQLQLNLTQQLHNILVRMSLPSHAKSSFCGHYIGPVLRGKHTGTWRLVQPPAIKNLRSELATNLNASACAMKGGRS
ncbi:MAG: hypothetical protein NXH91_19630, partial [Phyllobacteriaceae bacterium]|nr:hypothetical protein [Phyllobacteriaceae bacterium]